MKNKLTIHGKLVDQDSAFLTKKLSAKELNKLVAEVSNDIKQKEPQAINDAVRKLNKMG
ncbi:hypothetical protein N7922_13845 [Kosakonia sp. ML.JS2a]|uniref:hypothetical protein n=1 Tax=Kosakonia sp. ML.JS2a TaxID=2980557 RepID=UPI0021D83820|nr:hypothetical protein [Kosakonia sp. ML.JS2a]UXY08974.1 hypothetical protein N7922_13845 [Kosakonia sp. ML.JS2a]